MYKNLKIHLQEFVKVSKKDFNHFVSKTKLVKLEKNEHWKLEGKISQEFGFVKSGLLRHYYIDNGNEKTEKFYTEQSWLGDYGSFLSNTTSMRNYVALEKSELLILNFNELQNFYNTVPSIEKFGRLYAEQLLIELHNRNRSFLLDSAEKKYIKFKVDFPELPQRIPQYLIAQYLGIKPETLSRIRKNIN
jgi:CRP-like cAMP-binding protein